MPYTVSVIQKIDDFLPLEHSWNDLLKHKGSYHPFLSHEWFRLWIDHFLQSDQLLILIIKDKGKIQAIFPFMLSTTISKKITITTLKLIGNIYSPVRNFIFADIQDTSKEHIISEALHFLNTSIDWHILELDSLPEEDSDVKILKKALSKSNLKYKETFRFGNWYLDNIHFTGEEYIQTRTSNIRKNIKRYSKKLNKMGDLQFVIITTGDDEEIAQYMRHYYAVYNNSWKEPELDPTLHLDLAKLASKKGWLRLGILFLDSTPIAAQLWLVCNNIAYIVKLAYDENYKKHIPGVILSTEMYKYVIDIDRVKEVDYLIGDESYKKDWTPSRRERKTLIIFNTNLKGNCSAFIRITLNNYIEKYHFLNMLKWKFLNFLDRSPTQ